MLPGRFALVQLWISTFLVGWRTHGGPKSDFEGLIYDVTLSPKPPGTYYIGY